VKRIKIALITVFVIFAVFGGTACLSNRTLGDPPAVQRGEFPFRLEYEFDGEITVIEDVLVGEFDGNDWNAGWGVHPTWRGSLLSGRERIVLFADDEIEIVYRPTRLSSSLGTFMGDRSSGMTWDSTPTIFRTRGDDTRWVSSADLYYTYNIRIISWEIAPPIRNTFP